MKSLGVGQNAKSQPGEKKKPVSAGRKQAASMITETENVRSAGVEELPSPQNGQTVNGSDNTTAAPSVITGTKNGCSAGGEDAPSQQNGQTVNSIATTTAAASATTDTENGSLAGAHKDLEIAKLKTTISELAAFVADLKSEKRKDMEKISELTKEVKDLKQYCREYRAERSDLKREIRTLRAGGLVRWLSWRTKCARRSPIWASMRTMRTCGSANCRAVWHYGLGYA